jgi:phage-related protein
MADALPVAPDLAFKSSRKTTAKVIRAAYGDGYSQRTGDGLNAIRREWTWVWEGLTAAEYASLISAFETAAGVAPLSYDSRLWTVSEWQDTPAGTLGADLTATAREEFDLT